MNVRIKSSGFLLRKIVRKIMRRIFWRQSLICLKRNTKTKKIFFIFIFKSKLNLMTNRNNWRRENRKCNVGRKKNRRIIYTSKWMRIFICTKEISFKIVHKMSQSRGEKGFLIPCLNLGIKMPMKTNASCCLRVTQMDYIKHFSDVSGKVIKFMQPLLQAI